jgi:hypothetical protein
MSVGEANPVAINYQLSTINEKRGIAELRKSPRMG